MIPNSVALAMGALTIALESQQGPRITLHRTRAEQILAALTTPPSPAALTPAMLADALGCFWNGAIGAAHSRQDSTAFAVVSCVAEGIAAVEARLRELATTASPAAAEDEACVHKFGRMNTHICVRCGFDAFADTTQPAAAQCRHDFRKGTLTYCSKCGASGYGDPSQPSAAQGWVLVPKEPVTGPEYDAGNWSCRNWDAALSDQLAAAPQPQADECPACKLGQATCGYHARNAARLDWLLRRVGVDHAGPYIQLGSSGPPDKAASLAAIDYALAGGSEE